MNRTIVICSLLVAMVAASALAAPTQDGIIVVQRRGPAPKSGPAPDPDPVPSVPVEKKPRVVVIQMKLG
ncbi:uncharacterized protein LOC113207746 isoform X3 [Frankliniella occidentalis]|uniref:Uncharacterized protein LOC113207746 isoform X3 n=1 Tax=Frankliniella occidentalis TaxID=133901 RepID=A0A9C6XQ94_FRAOC|nr:uncharacterized protein LOC113207746 isoform X3 [Frankliniella occidentalis]